MNIQNEILSILKSAVDNKFELSVSFSNRPEICDFQSNSCFALAKQLNTSPIQLGEEIISKIPQNSKFDFQFVKPGFINIKIKDDYLGLIADKICADKLCGLEKNKTSKKIVMDFGGANVAKELHVGHLRSPIIGESLKRLHKVFGDEVIADAHLGDWGLQMGLTVLQLFEDGVLSYWFNGEKAEPKITLDMLNEAYPKASKRKSIDEEFLKKAQDFTVKIQQKQEPYFSIYKKIREVSVKEIEKNYADLGAEFDLFYGESDAQPFVEKAIDIFVEKGLTEESEGCLIVPVAREGEHIPLPKKDENDVQRFENPMPPVILKKPNGADVYATTDIATVLQRNEIFKNPDEIFYVVDSRQDSHFERFFRACKLAKISKEEQKLVFIGFGTMNGKDGKPFKTRDGSTIKLNDIINLLVEKASQKIESNGIKATRSLALKIGVSAMKFGDLINSVTKDYIFDIDKFLSFEGKTGPYIQYTIARINSILAKTDAEKGKIQIEFEDERKIVISLLKLISSYKICYEEHSLNSLCQATFDLASAFSTFYNNHHILNEKNLDKKKSYISLCHLVKNSLEQALWVLGIESVEKM